LRLLKGWFRDSGFYGSFVRYKAYSSIFFWEVFTPNSAIFLNPQQRKAFADGESGCFWLMERDTCPGQSIGVAGNNIKKTHFGFNIF
jgi:hypothetical protein